MDGLRNRGRRLSGNACSWRKLEVWMEEVSLLVIVALVLTTVACDNGSSDTKAGDARADPSTPSTVADAPDPSPTADEVESGDGLGARRLAVRLAPSDRLVV